MFVNTAQDLLTQILPQVSRSFYLSLRVLPQSVRQPLGLAYLFCRAADTIADTVVFPPHQRLTYLERYRAAFEKDLSAVVFCKRELSEAQSQPAERELLARIPECFTLLATLSLEDQRYIRELVLTLTQGMQMDLQVFPQEHEGG